MSNDPKPEEPEPSKTCPNCGRKFRSFDRLHLHWILYTCTGPREAQLVADWKRTKKETFY